MRGTKSMVMLVAIIIMGLVTSSKSSSIMKTDSELVMSTLSSNHSPSLESLVDSRFKQLAIGLQGQVDELKDKVVRLEAANKQGMSKEDHHRGMQKRQANNGNKTSSPACESRRSLCSTYFHRDHPDIGRERGKISDMPTNCKDLQLLGHQLNGFYLVKKAQSGSKNKGNNNKIETVYCDFHLDSINGKRVETRIGVVDVKTSLVQFSVEREGYNFGGDERGKITFEKQSVNVGNGFDWTKQEFRAPYTGIYFFSISGTKDFGTPNSDRAAVSFQINGEGHGEAISSDKTDFGAVSYQLIRKLKANDKVEVVLKYGQLFTLYFSGWMLDEDLQSF